MFKLKKNIIKRYLFSGIIILSVIIVVPWFILGENSYIRIHDNLDSGFVYQYLIAKTGTIFKPDASIKYIMNGLPRKLLGSSYYIPTWFYTFLKPYNAYFFNALIVHIISFIGIFFLLKKYFITEEEQLYIVFGVSFCFAIIPYYTNLGLTIAGQPLLLYAFLNLLNNKNNIINYIIIIFFPFYSFLALSGIFIIFTLFIIFATNSYKKKKINKYFLIGLTLLVIMYLFVESNLITSILFDKQYVSHRTEWNEKTMLHSLSLTGIFKEILTLLLLGQYHATSVHLPVLLLTIYVTKKLLDSKKLKQEKFFSIIIFLIIFIIIFSSFYHWKALYPIKKYIPILKYFNITRFLWLLPLLWYILFAVLLSFLHKKQYNRKIIILLIIIQILYSNLITEGRGAKQELLYNFVLLITKNENIITYKKFFSKKLFNEIREYINEPQENYRVVSIGIHPSIAQFNGFFTLDSYLPNYPLWYKKKFRKIIEKELSKNRVIQNYFDNWGSRCYIFTSKYSKSYQMTKYKNFKIDNFEININALKDMNGKYIFSAAEILNYRENNLSLLNTFERDDSPWKIYLYKPN